MSKFISQYDSITTSAPNAPQASDELLLQRGNKYFKFTWQDVIDTGGGGGSPLTTKGDLFTFIAADARLPVGSDNFVLSADSGEATGLKWVSTNSTGIYQINGALKGNRIVSQAALTLAFTGSAVNMFSVDGTTFSVDATNDRVGVNTIAPLATFHVDSGTLRVRGIGATSGLILDLRDQANLVKMQLNDGGQFSFGEAIPGTVRWNFRQDQTSNSIMKISNQTSAGAVKINLTNDVGGGIFLTSFGSTAAAGNANKDRIEFAGSVSATFNSLLNKDMIWAQAGTTRMLIQAVNGFMKVGTGGASERLDVGGNILCSGSTDSVTYKVNGVAGANFSGVVTNLTVVDGLVTAAS